MSLLWVTGVVPKAPRVHLRSLYGAVSETVLNWMISSSMRAALSVVCLGEKLGAGEGNFRGGGVDVGGEGRDADDGESRIGFGGHVGVVGGNEV